MKVSKQKIKLLSYFNIIVGSIFLVFTILSFAVLDILYASVQIVLVSDAYFSLFLTSFFGAVLAFSGFIITESKMERNCTIIGWLGIIFGGIFIITSIIPIFTAAVITYTYTTLIVSLVWGSIGYLITVLNGYCLRKLL